MSYRSFKTVFFCIALVISLLSLSITPLAAAPLAQAVGDTFTVNTTDDTIDTGGIDGICADANGDCSLRAAISQANTDDDEDTIIVPPGTYTIGLTTASEDNNQSGDFDIKESLTINGADAATTTLNWMIGTTTYDRIFHVDPLSQDNIVFRVSGLTLRGANRSALDVYDVNDELFVNNCAFIDNIAGYEGFNYRGGALQNVGTASIQNSTFADNNAAFDNQYGGGGAIHNTGTMTIDNSFVTDNISDKGGGIFNTGTLTITNSHVDRNFANIVGNGGGNGGGIYNTGTLTIEDSFINENNLNAGTGGGIFNTGILTVRNSMIEDNLTHFGGGIYNSGSLARIENTTIRNNATKNFYGTEAGAGVYNDNNMVIVNSLITGNTAHYMGGGIHNRATLRIVNSTISNNTVLANPNSRGGGIWNQGSLYLNFATIANNTVSIEGGGLFQSNTTGSTTASNTIIAGNNAVVVGYDCFYAGGATDRMVSEGFNLLGNDNNCPDFVNTDDLVNVNPLLGPLQDNGGPTHTHALLEGSPAIDAAPINACTWDDDANNATARVALTVDQRGYLRPYGSACDIGAFEWHPIPPEILSLWFYTTDTPTLTWNRVSWATGYHVQVARDTNFTDIVYDNPGIAVSTLEVTITPALADDEYYWHVRALNGGTHGDWSNPIKITVDAP